MTEQRSITSIAELDAWLKTAKRGERAVYHTGRLYDDRKNDAVKRLANAIWKLSEDGKVFLTQRMVRVMPETTEKLRKQASSAMQRYISTGRDLRAIASEINGLLKVAPPDNPNAHYFEYLITKGK